LVAGLAVALVLALPPARLVRARVALAAAALAVGLAAPAAYSLSTAATPHKGAIPSAGPAGASRGGFGGRPRFGGRFGPGGIRGRSAPPQGGFGSGRFGRQGVGRP